MTSLAKSFVSSSKALLTLQEIVRPIVEPLDLVEEKLRGVGQESEGILKDASRYVLHGGGKRLRAALVFFCASIQEGQSSKAALTSPSIVDIAAAVELIHSATLVHDDVIDHSVLRRLQPTVGVQFGDEVALLLGDFLYARAFAMISKVGDAGVTTWMAETTQEMCEGELGQLKGRYRAELSMDEYLSFIRAKTATLIAVSARAGAKLGGLSRAQQDGLYEFGLNIGISYQIVDDMLDIVGSEHKLGKTLHTDAGNGKMTLPMILLMKDMDEQEKSKFLKEFQSKQPDWNSIQSLLGKYNVIPRTQAYADDYFAKALESLKPFQSPVRQSLENLSRFILKRDY